MSEPNIPEWLTADFLKSCLESDEGNGEGVTITNYTAESGVPAGNNYGSNILRVKITYKKQVDNSIEHSVSLILKVPLGLDAYGEEFGEFLKEAYQREPKYYNEFIAETYKLIKHNIVPKHYRSPNSLCVVLEDLKTSGYMMVDRHKLLDFDHCRLYVKASSKLHALSVAVYKTHPEMIESLVDNSLLLAPKTQELTKKLQSIMLKCMAVYLNDKPGHKDFSEFFRSASESEAFWNISQEMEKTDRQLKSVIQQDPWCTNLMFKYGSAGDVVDVKIFDFQGLKFTTPVWELVTFLWANANPEVKETRLNDLYHLYCDSLNSSFEELGCLERLSFECLKAEILSLSPLVLLTVCGLALFCLADEVVNMNDFIKEDNFDIPVKETPIYKLYEGTTFNKYYPQVINQVAKEGVFDYLKQKMNQINVDN